MSVSSFQALDYLEQLPVQTHRKLYEQPSTVLAVFRCMLPHLGLCFLGAHMRVTGANMFA